MACHLAPNDEQIERAAIFYASARINGQECPAIALKVMRWPKEDRQWFAELVVKAEDMIIAVRADELGKYKRRYRIFG